ncbi:MAG: iron-containing alcohol dehydrogenase, partial [Candidatus Micrarchaeota archaeon]
MFGKKKESHYKFINLPQKVLVGAGVIDRVSDVAGDYTSSLVVSGKNTIKVAGEKVFKKTGGEKIIIKKANMESVSLVAKAAAKHDVIIAVGGGKVIDVSKLAAFKLDIDYITVPTTCSNDGIASAIASIKYKGAKQSIIAKTPMAVVADTEVIIKSPYKFLAAGLGDIIAKYTAVRDWKLGKVIRGEYYGDYASELSSLVAKMGLENAQEIRDRTEQGINILIEALISSGAAMGIAGSSRPASGSEHKFSHALDEIANTPSMHGYQVGVGTIAMSYLHGEDWKKIKNAL